VQPLPDATWYYPVFLRRPQREPADQRRETPIENNDPKFVLVRQML
jgi:hypothetical protein